MGKLRRAKTSTKIHNNKYELEMTNGGRTEFYKRKSVVLNENIGSQRAMFRSNSSNKIVCNE